METLEMILRMLISLSFFPMALLILVKADFELETAMNDREFVVRLFLFMASFAAFAWLQKTLVENPFLIFIPIVIWILHRRYLRPLEVAA